MPHPIKHYPRFKLLSQLPTSLPLFKIAEMAIILGRNTKLVHQLIDDGLLTYVQLGNEKHFLRVRAQDLENFIDAHIRNKGIPRPKSPNDEEE